MLCKLMYIIWSAFQCKGTGIMHTTCIYRVQTQEHCYVVFLHIRIICSQGLEHCYVVFLHIRIICPYALEHCYVMFLHIKTIYLYTLRHCYVMLLHTRIICSYKVLCQNTWLIAALGFAIHVSKLVRLNI